MSKLEIHQSKIAWQEPLNFAQKIADNYKKESWILLYSGLNDKVKNSFSYIGIFPQKKIVTNDFFAAEEILKNSNETWFGYLAYEVGNDLEKLPKTKKSFVSLPKIYLLNFEVIFEFDHNRKKLTVTFCDQKKLQQILKWKSLPQQNQLSKPKIKNFNSNFSNQSYLKTVAEIKEMIARGDFYQTNLTRKFFGKFTKRKNHQENFQLFKQLTKSSTANYSAFLKLDKNYIISSSPELFLKIAKNGKILSRPIKGTTARSTDKIQDKKNKLTLKNSIKERAENLMIVDLVRNDLSKVCKAGSVVVKKLFAVNSYQNIHHMSSEIHGKISKKFSSLDAIKACFPAGSMTGAPKIKAIEFAAKKEQLNRGVYSGTLGFFSQDQANLSVVIRTLIVQDDKFEFQVGGAITFDSDASQELQETFSKAKAICEVLGLDFSDIS